MIAADATVGAREFPALVCPEHATPLEGGGGDLRCREGDRFAVRDGIPRIVAAAASYADAFGEQWNHYRTTQLDSYTRSTISRDRLQRCLGPEMWRRLHETGRLDVLEMGCGAGRFTEILLQTPAAFVTSADLSSAVDANARNCPLSDRHRVVQCDIFGMPFRPGSFDLVICIGVLQHTPDPEAAIGRLYEQVTPGGWLVIDHYRPSLSQYTKVTANLLRPVLKRLPPTRGTAVTEALTRFWFPLHKAVKRHRVLQMALSRVSPLLTYFQAYPQLDDRLQFEWALLDTHDSLTDYYKHLRTPRQIRATLERLGGEAIHVARGGNGVEGRCRRPAA